jgi:hypothetical protein
LGPGDEENFMSISRLVCTVLVCGLLLLGTGDAQARHRRCGTVGFDPYAGGYGTGYSPGAVYPGYVGQPVGYGYPAVAQPFYGGGAYYGGECSPYAQYQDRRRRDRRRTRNIVLGIGAAAILATILSR